MGRNLNKEYLPITGLPEFTAASVKLALGDELAAKNKVCGGAHPACRTSSLYTHTLCVCVCRNRTHARTRGRALHTDALDAGR
jgi:hypothetical protein